MKSVKKSLGACPVCILSSREGSLGLYAVSLEEDVIMCDQDECCYFTEVDKPKLKPVYEMPVVPTPPTTPEVTLSTLSKPCEIQTLHNIDNLQSNTPSLPSQTISIIDTITPSTLCSSTGLINQKSPTPGQQTRLDGGQKPHGAELNSQYPYIMLWSNIDALCWLDVLLCHLCYSGSVRRHIGSISYSSVLKKLITAFEEAQALIAPLQKNMDSFLHSVMELENVAVKRGGGFCLDGGLNQVDGVAAPLVSSKDVNMARRKLNLASIKLECAREEIWQTIEPKLRCKRGADDSPVFALPVILEAEPSLARQYEVRYSWVMSCLHCLKVQVTVHKNMLPTFTSTTPEFSMQDMFYLRPCFKCGAKNQRRQLRIDKHPPTLAIHFADGLHHSDLTRLAFTSPKGDMYAVDSIIEYRTSPNHFVIWQKNPDNSGEAWMVYDDLRSPYAQFSTKEFSAPAKNIHIVVWQLAPSSQPSGTTLTQMDAIESLSNPSSQRVHGISSSNVEEGSIYNYPKTKPTKNTPKKSGSSTGLNLNYTSNSTVTVTSKIKAEARPASVRAADTGSVEGVSASLCHVSSQSEVDSLFNSLDTGPVEIDKPCPTETKKLSLSLGCKLKTPSPQVNAVAVVQSLGYTQPTSYDQILNNIRNIASPLPSPTSTQSRSSTPSNLTSAPSQKSYLDMVQPLLRKTRQKTSQEGYISKRKLVETEELQPKKKKSVLFVEEPRKAKGVKRTKVATVNPEAVLSQRVKKVAAAKQSFISDKFSIPTPTPTLEERCATSPLPSDVNMPSLDDMLTDLAGMF